MILRSSEKKKLSLWGILFYGLVISLCLSGCAKQKEKKIVFAIGGAPVEIEYWEKLIGRFEKESGFDVDIQRQPTDTDQRRQGLVVPLKAKKKDPDVFLMDVVWLPQFSASDWLLPLDSFIENDKMDMSAFFPRVIDMVDRFEGRTIALPIYVDGGLLYYRKDLLKQFGYSRPPKTWRELAEISIKIQNALRKKDPKFYGFVWQGAQYEGLICNFLEFAVSFGGGITLKNGKIVLNTPENKIALEFMRDLIHKYKISPPDTYTGMKEEEVRILFQEGHALFERNWPYAWVLHQAEGSPVKGKVGIVPLPYAVNRQHASTLGGWHIGISRYSDVPNLAWQFVKFAVSYETQKDLAIGLGWNPGRRDVYRDTEVLTQSPHLAKLEQVFENAVARPTLPYYTQVSGVMQRYINGVLSGEMEVDEALEISVARIKKIMEKYRK